MQVLRTGYWGIPDQDIPIDTPANLGSFWVFINSILYIPILALVKASTLLLLLRLGSANERTRLACYVMIALNLAQLFTFLPIAAVRCLPIESSWMTTVMVPNAKCLRKDIFDVSLAVVNIATDILTLLIPFSIFLGLRINRRVRIALLTVFMLGALSVSLLLLRWRFILLLVTIP